ncbi:SWIM zinc finger family protein [Saccharolobus islandicus]|uniref:Zinc finger SWIM domain protein n=4 Tax=Saccharolobus islandicus TaxID=43080 RepID=C4KIS3_SACI6|nr:SWIM zinc finger family protein [Sulfolobus islandicus]ACP38621.1 zinc finger SWIM domain protein [Sulfolobus islandicus M.14.25]ACP55825.1 zinc finger SWIM domain protein [Sulfolobus islandicus M.16.27]ACR42487.1 zinc finger SWIM domain protein [Sulfolobus islandicus M.16.4]ADX83161.1 zinc finger SWIM domain protein [Sulfolobus islandicus HVE10/4]WCM38067.1 hypothetical protein GO599_11825 [Sulfolobus islandicus]
MSSNQTNRHLLLKARRVVKEGRFVSLSLKGTLFTIFIYIGRNNDYTLNLNYCSCPFYLFNVLLRNKYDFCYHTLGLKYALEKDQLTKIELYTEDFKEILTEIYTCGKSLKLRRILSNVES